MEYVSKTVIRRAISMGDWRFLAHHLRTGAAIPDDLRDHLANTLDGNRRLDNRPPSVFTSTRHTAIGICIKAWRRAGLSPKDANQRAEERFGIDRRTAQRALARLELDKLELAKGARPDPDAPFEMSIDFDRQDFSSEDWLRVAEFIAGMVPLYSSDKLSSLDKIGNVGFHEFVDTRFFHKKSHSRDTN
jgi:hypothetical protein